MPTQKKYGPAELSRIEEAGDGKVIPSPASRVLKKLSGTIKENDLFRSILEAAPNPSPGARRFIALLADAKRIKADTMLKLAAEAEVPVYEIFEAYASGVKRMGQHEAIAMVAEAMMPVMRTLIAQATPKRVPCPKCSEWDEVEAGSDEQGDAVLEAAGAEPIKQLPRKRRPKVCRMCGGKGEMEQLPQFFAFAVNKVLDIAEMIPKDNPGGVSVQVGVNNAQQPAFQGGLQEKLLTMSDEISHTARKAKELAPAKPPSIMEQMRIEAEQNRVLQSVDAEILMPEIPEPGSH